MENKSWNDFKFQIYWNKLEWVNPGRLLKQKFTFVFILG